MLEKRGCHGRAVALRADDSARHHKRVSCRVAVAHGIDLVGGDEEEGDLLHPDEEGLAPGRLEIIDGARGFPGGADGRFYEGSA